MSVWREHCILERTQIVSVLFYLCVAYLCRIHTNHARQTRSAPINSQCSSHQIRGSLPINLSRLTCQHASSAMPPPFSPSRFTQSLHLLRKANTFCTTPQAGSTKSLIYSVAKEETLSGPFSPGPRRTTQTMIRPMTSQADELPPHATRRFFPTRWRATIGLTPADRACMLHETH